MRDMTDAELSSQWDTVRTSFSTSIMVDTALSSLAENLDGPQWPGTDKRDCPSDYIDFNYAETIERLNQRGYPEGTMEELITILSETLAFDDPFGDMVEHSEAAAAAENPILENLKKLEIPANYPIEFTSLSNDAKEFCELEQLTTLGEFAVFAQGMSQNVIVGGDFKTLLNALSHVDEKAIAKFLPFRPGEKGLHFVESVGGVARNLRKLERDKLLAGGNPGMETTAQVAKLAHHFADDLAALKTRIGEGGELSREVMVLQDPTHEPVVAGLLRVQLPGAAVKSKKKTSWLGRLFGR
jgi:hypothetical protein